MTIKAFRLKIAGLVVLVLAMIIAVRVFRPIKHAPKAELRDTSRIKTEVAKSDLEPQPKTQQPIAKRLPEATLPLRQLSKNSEAKEPLTKPEKLYRMASALKETGNSSYASNRIIIACCQRLLEQYPNSLEAEKAKQLLQEVPEQFRNRYDEEMSFLHPKEPKVRKSKRLRHRIPELPLEERDIIIEETAH